jgi:hypothetical protein
VAGSYVRRMDEWRWDLGFDGVVRLVREGDVETVYVDGRIAARTMAARDEHRVLLTPRPHTPVEATSDAYRHTEPRTRELRLCRTPRGWVGVLDGRNVAPTRVSLESALPEPVPGRGRGESRGRTWLLASGVGALLVGAAVVYSFASPTGFLRVAAERDALLKLPHETELTTTVSNESGSVTLRAPSDFTVDETTTTSIRLVRKALAEAFEAGIVPSPRTSDLDEILRAATDAVRQRVAQSPSVQDVKVTFAAPASASCHGEPGRAVTGTFVTGAARTMRTWTCASLRPGVGIGEHLPSVQIFDYFVSEHLAARDEPLFASMIAGTTIREDGLPSEVPALSTTRPEPFTPLSTILAGPPRTGSPSYAPQIVRLPP